MESEELEGEGCGVEPPGRERTAATTMPANQRHRSVGERKTHLWLTLAICSATATYPTPALLPSNLPIPIPFVSTLPNTLPSLLSNAFPSAINAFLPSSDIPPNILSSTSRSFLSGVNPNVTSNGLSSMTTSPGWISRVANTPSPPPEIRDGAMVCLNGGGV